MPFSDSGNPPLDESNNSPESDLNPTTRAALDALRSIAENPLPMVIPRDDSRRPSWGVQILDDDPTLVNPARVVGAAEREKLAAWLEKLDAAGGGRFLLIDQPEIKREIMALHAEVRTLAELLKKLDAADDRGFTSSEQAEIKREIAALHAEVRTLAELNPQQKVIVQLLEEVQSGSERMGRKDWVTLVIGAATSLVIMEMIPPLALLPLAVHAVHALGHLLVDA